MTRAKYPSQCPVARWAGDGRDYVIAPALYSDYTIATQFVHALPGCWTTAGAFTPLNAAARAVLAVARGGK